MLSISLFIVAFLNILLFIIYGFSDTPGVAYDIDYRVEDVASDYCGRSKSQIYFDDNKFEMKSVVEEITPNNEKLYFETKKKKERIYRSVKMFTV